MINNKIKDRKNKKRKRIPKLNFIRKKKTSKNNTKKRNKNFKVDFKKLNRNFWMFAAVIIFIIVFCIYKLIIFVQNPTDTFRVENGQIYEEERANGYIIREETIVKGENYKNGIEEIKAEGERVAKGEAIFRYYTTGEESLKNKITELDVKIDEVIANESDLFSSDTKALEKQIENSIVSLRQENRIQTITKTKKEISNNIVKKAKIAGDLSPSGSYLKKLINERSKYENKLNEGAEYIKSPISGVVSYKVDGYEDVLTTDNFENINIEFLENLKLKTGQIVADSKESAKIINNFECYIACILDSEQTKKVQKGDSVKLRLSNNLEISAQIKYLAEENQKRIIVFEVNKQVQELISYRKISFDIIWWSDSGKKIPNDVIRYEQKENNQVAYIIRTRSGYQNKILIKILRQNEKYAIVDNYTSAELKELGYTDEEINERKTLTLYDEIVKKPT